MTTTESYSKPKNPIFSAYKQTVKQGKAFSIVTGVIFLLMVMLPNFIYLADSLPTDRYLPKLEHGFYIAREHTIPITIFFIIMTMIVGFNLNSYLFSKKETDFYHSTPIKRSQLLTANFLSAITIIGAPFLVLSLIFTLFYGTLYSIHTVPNFFIINALEIAFVLLSIVVIYLFVTLIAVSVGTLFDNVILTGVIAFIPLTIYFIVGALLSSFLYGYQVNPSSNLLFLSPFTFIFKRFVFDSVTFLSIELMYIFIVGVVMAVAFFFLAQLCYSKRKSEDAENKLMESWPQIASKIVVAFVSAAIFFAIFFDYSMIPALFAAFIGGLLLSFIYELVLSRGVSGIKKNFKWLLIGVGLFIFTFIFTRFDLYGYENRVPAANQVSSVSINYNGRFSSLANQYEDITLTDPRAVEIVVSTHQEIVDNKPPENYNWHSYADNSDYTYGHTGILYKLKNGGTVQRYYSIVATEALDNLVALEGEPDFIKVSHPIFSVKDFSRTVEQGTFRNSNTGEIYNLSADQIATLIPLLQEDMLNESLDSILATQNAVGMVTMDYYSTPNPNYRSEAKVLITSEYLRSLPALKSFELTSNVTETISQANYARIIDSREYYYLRNMGVNVFLDEFNRRSSYDTFIFESTDSATISTLQDNSYIQKLIDPKIFTDSSNYYIVDFYKDDAYLSSGIISSADLPANLQTEILASQEKLQSEYDNQYYDTEYDAEYYGTEYSQEVTTVDFDLPMG